MIGRRITFFHFGFVPQWVSFSSMMMRSPGVNWVYLNGPVPAYFILLKSSVFGQAVTPSQPALLNFRSSGAPPFLAEMMAMLLTVIAISGNGSAVVMMIVCGSGAVMVSTMRVEAMNEDGEFSTFGTRQ